MITLLAIASYFRVSLATTTLAASILMVIGTSLQIININVWLAFILLTIPVNIVGIRRQIITKPILTLFRKLLPEMSLTEKQAIEAGTTWWDAELFSGKPNWKKLHNYPSPRLTAEEQAFIDGPVEQVCKMVNQHNVSHQLADLPQNVWDYLKENGFFSLIIDKKYGGLAFSAYAQSKVLQKLAGISSELASSVGVPNSLGPGELLQEYGTESQKNYYLPRLAKGLEIPCFALTNPEAGSDASSIPDYGIICKGEWEGQQVLGMKLTWNKRYITLAPIATLLGLAFKLKDPDQLIGTEKEIGITCALIPTNIKGVNIGRRHLPLNCMFQNGPTQGNQVFVPLSFIIGGEKMAGQGWRMLVECLSVGRGITLPSNAAGGIKSIAIATGAYAKIRQQFKSSIGNFEGIEEPLARLAGNAYLMDAVTSLTTTAIDLGEKPSVISAIVKYHLTDRMQKCVIDAMDIHGGKGICLGPNNYLGRGYQAAPIAVTVEGANILTRAMIIYGQGAIRCHPYVLNEMEAAFEQDPHKGLNKFDHAIFGHIGFTTSNFIRSFWLGITGAYFSGTPYHDETKRYYQLINRFSANLAFLSDILMVILGGNLKRKERISARLGDLLSQLYLVSAVLKQFREEQGKQQNLPLVKWSIEDALFKLQTSLDQLLNNFPSKLAPLIRLIIFPLGHPVKGPSDTLDHQVAKIIQTPSQARDRLAQGQFLTPCEFNPIGIQEQTLVDLLACQPLYNKVCQAMGEKLPFIWLDQIAAKGKTLAVLTDDEVALLERAEIGRLKSINVDDFSSSELQNLSINSSQEIQAAS